MVDNNTDGPNGLPSIRGKITIKQQALGASIVRDVGAPGFRIFHVAPEGKLNLFGLFVGNGRIDESVNDIGPFFAGGGIFVGGILEIERVIIGENEVFAFDGSLGGGIYNSGQVTIVDSRLRNNISGGGAGGGIYSTGDLSIVRSSINGNGAFTAGG